MYKLIMRMLCYPAGLIIKSLGITLMIVSRAGTDAWNGLYVGMSNQFGFTVGTWVILIGMLIILLNAGLKKGKPDLFSLLTVLILGTCIDFWLNILSFYPVNRLEQMLTFWAGLICTCFGISVYVQGKFALTPCDDLMYVLCRRFRLSLAVSKTLMDGFALVFALMLHGPISVGTVIFTFLSGPLVQFFAPKIDGLLERVK